jgi:hypothetical protein
MLPRAEKRLLAEAWLRLVAMRLLLACRRFEHVLATCRLVQSDSGDAGSTHLDVATVHAIRTAIARAAPRVPFGAACLAQALVAATMLARRGLPARVYLGGRLGGDAEWAFHAWTNSGEILATPADAQGHLPIVVHVAHAMFVDKKW